MRDKNKNIFGVNKWEAHSKFEQKMEKLKSLYPNLAHKFRVIWQCEWQTLKKENEAALWAVAILVGSNKFADMIGLDSLPYNLRSTQINGRFNLSLHYVYSMIIEMTTNVSLSNKIGLYKELLDSEGGSGFSFDDLVADRAGTKLAHVATLDNKHAVHMQTLFASNEIILLPKLDFPKNNLKSNNFELYFGGARNSELEAIIKRIEAAIENLEIYKL